MKLVDYELNGISKELEDFKDDLLTIINFGKLSFQQVSEPPTWTANNGESVFYSAGADKRWYFYTGGAWRNISFNNQIISAWVTFSGTGAGNIKESFNVRSVTRNGAGDYTLNFSNTFSNSNYSVVGFCVEQTIPGSPLYVCIDASTANPTRTSCRINTSGFRGFGNADSALVNTIIVGNV